MNKEIIGTANKNGLLEFFNTMVKKGALSKQDLADYEEGKKVFYTADLYVRKFLGTTLSGVVDLINENDVEFITRCNLSKGRIPDEMNLIASHIDLKFASALSSASLSATPELVDYSNAIYDIADVVADAGASAVSGASVVVKRLPTSWTNGEYEIKCDDGLIDKGRISEMCVRNTVGYGSQGQAENKKMLFWPKLLPAGKTLRCQLKFPATATGIPGSSDLFAELSIKGIYLGKRPGA